MTTVKTIRAAIASEAPRSAWSRGVNAYALDLLDGMPETDVLAGKKTAKETLLSGAKDWMQYSYGGCALIYDGDIAERLCCPSELKRNRNGDRRPNSREDWLDVQARALHQACNRIRRIARAGGAI